jgi:Type II secretion system protein C
MRKKWVFLNVGLLLTAAFLGWHLRTSIWRFNADNDLARVQPAKDLKKGSAEETLPALQSPVRYDPAQYLSIPDQNLFSESRAKEEKADVAAAPEVPPLTVRPVLVGIVAGGEKRMALIIDPSASGSGRKTHTKRLGDTYQGYTVTDISESKMVLENGGRREVIPLFDGSKRPGQGGKTAVIPTRVVSFGTGSTSAGGIAAQKATPAAAAATRPGTTAASAPAGSTPAAAATAAQQSGIVRGAQGRQVMTAPQGSQSPGETMDSQGRTVIRTPFGDIVRPKPPNQ